MGQKENELRTTCKTALGWQHHDAQNLANSTSNDVTIEGKVNDKKMKLYFFFSSLNLLKFFKGSSGVDFEHSKTDASLIELKHSNILQIPPLNECISQKIEN